MILCITLTFANHRGSSAVLKVVKRSFGCVEDPNVLVPSLVYSCLHERGANPMMANGRTSPFVPCYTSSLLSVPRQKIGITGFCSYQPSLSRFIGRVSTIPALIFGDYGRQVPSAMAANFASHQPSMQLEVKKVPQAHQPSSQPSSHWIIFTFSRQAQT